MTEISALDRRKLPTCFHLKKQIKIVVYCFTTGTVKMFALDRVEAGPPGAEPTREPEMRPADASRNPTAENPEVVASVNLKESSLHSPRPELIF